MKRFAWFSEGLITSRFKELAAEQDVELVPVAYGRDAVLEEDLGVLAGIENALSGFDGVVAFEGGFIKYLLGKGYTVGMFFFDCDDPEKMKVAVDFRVYSLVESSNSSGVRRQAQKEIDEGYAALRRAAMMLINSLGTKRTEEDMEVARFLVRGFKQVESKVSPSVVDGFRGV